VAKRVLITGGAGFIGSHLADELLAAGYDVRVLDSLVPQVHGDVSNGPSYLSTHVELVIGDIRDAGIVRDALADVDAVCHLAAMVGVGQSMYDVARYADVNAVGTATLLEALMTRRAERLVVASSMSIYGEGLYETSNGQPIVTAGRSADQLKSGDWELRGVDGEPLVPVPTPESKPPSLTSVYALTKFDQERLCLMIGQAYEIPTTALRFFNVFGTRQALSNPYTGVLAIFASRLLNSRRPILFEDGRQRRDFVHVTDVARACRLALEASPAVSGVFNIASGHSISVLEVAERMAAVMGRSELTPEVTGQYRVGDIRHCIADISRARCGLGYTPSVTFEDGLAELAGWLAGEVAIDRVDEARAELAVRGLTV
jgi:dTDP-L-rhamnose 4-epimerase